ncbi:myeloid-associated differentiation marker-like protein 2 [Ambystoma mexicanum]|uniref:myeloid-associated differentiation marker-like protein 2 n=1 Tax=Ambystoma mexicanum TaxID=8296 RepID=UPI0037E8E515
MRRQAATDGPYLNVDAVWSRVGLARLLQVAFACTTLSLVVHKAGYSAPYGIFCMSVWCACCAVSAFITSCELTRLHSCMRGISWGDFTAAFAMLATLTSLTAAIVYPVYFAQLGCYPIGCDVRDFRLAASVFASLVAVAYIVEVALIRAQPGLATSYMATVSGLLKVVQAFSACIIFGALANESQYRRFAATQWCVAVYSFCFIFTVVIIILSVTGRTGTLRCPFERCVVTFTVLAVLMYMSAAVIWPVFCFDSKYGSPQRPQYCPRGRCPWDSQLVITVFTQVNLLLYIVDLVYSQRIRFTSRT